MIERTLELESSIFELAVLNETVAGFTKIISTNTSVIESLQKNILALEKN